MATTQIEPSSEVDDMTDMTDTSEMTSRPPILDVRGVKKVYEDASRTVEAVRDRTFSIESGELACIVGPSGAGKRVTGTPAGMAVVFQEYGRSLFPWMTVWQNVELPLKEKKVPAAERRRLVQAALEAVGLADVPAAHPWQLSGGMQQRVAIARAVAYEPHILLMDEPFAAVDAQTRADLEDLVRSLWRRLGVTVLFVTHDIDESVYLGQRVIVLSSSPTVVMADVAIDLPDDRDQLTTRSAPRFTELRSQVYELIQQAKRGHRPAAATVSSTES